MVVVFDNGNGDDGDSGSDSSSKILSEERVVTIDENLLPTKSDVSATN